MTSTSTSSASEPDVDSVDLELLELVDDIVSGEHSGVGRGLISLNFHLHAARNSDQGLSAGQIRHVDERVVARGEDVAHSEHIVVVGDAWGTQGSAQHSASGGGLTLSWGSAITFGLGGILASLLGLGGLLGCLLWLLLALLGLLSLLGLFGLLFCLKLSHIGEDKRPPLTACLGESLTIVVVINN